MGSKHFQKKIFVFVVTPTTNRTVFCRWNMSSEYCFNYPKRGKSFFLQKRRLMRNLNNVFLKSEFFFRKKNSVLNELFYILDKLSQCACFGEKNSLL